MIPIQRIARFAAVFGILALAPVSRASAACPENMIFFGCYPDAVGYSYTEPTSDYNGEPWQIGDPCPIGCYDLHIGTIHTEARGNTAGPGCLAGVHTEDSFTIIGIPAGTPVNFFAEFQVTGSLSGPGSVGADEPGTYSFKIVGADGNDLDGVNSGLKSLSGQAITLTTDPSGVVVGAVGATVIFKVAVDSDGYVWIAQYQPIANPIAGSSAAAYDDIASVTAGLNWPLGLQSMRPLYASADMNMRL